MRVKSLLTGAALAAFCATGTPAFASSIILGNLPSNNNNLSNVGQGLTAAIEFMIGPNAFSLTDAILDLTLQAPASNQPLLQLRSDAGGVPGSVLLTFINPVFVTGTAVLQTFTAPAFTLDANTKYWLYLNSSSPNGAFFNWMGGNPAQNPSTAVATYLASTTGVVNSFQLDGNLAATTPVPEPASLLLVVGALPFLYRRVRKRR